ncbi:MAG: hydroxyacid dehydrogenase [Magnetovibrio sp.]|nr:hydroxyacid dehydrogenase [Magnetovibrio sp.]
MAETTGAKPTVVITNKPFAETVSYLEAHCRVVANDDVEPWSRTELIHHLEGARAMMAFMPDTVDGALLDACPDLAVISCALKGYDNFDLDACRERGVIVTFVPDLLTAPTAELAVGLTIGLARNVRAGDAYIRKHGFHGWRAHLYGKGLDGSTVGLLGAGAVGAATAERLQGFGCRLLYVDSRPLGPGEERRLNMTEVDIDALYADSDIIIVCLPLTAKTRHMVDARAIGRMKPGAHLVNISRGSVVDEAAVAAALESGHLAGYAADVFELEDWALAGRPREVDPRLLEPGAPTLFTPHIGSGVTQVRMEIERQAADNILHFLSGEIPDEAMAKAVG